MRCSFLVAGAMVSCLATLVTLAAQQPDPTPPPAGFENPFVVADYGANVLYAIHLIEDGYVHPVSRTDLVGAALRALYVASGELPPNSLKEDIQKAQKDENVNALRNLFNRTRSRPENIKRLRDSEARLVSCRAMLQLLDPHCEILEGDQVQRGSGRLDNYGVGIDLEDNSGTGPVRIREVHPGGPSQKAGLRPGDQITAIDGKRLEKVDSTEALRMLNTGRDFQFQTDQLLFNLPTVKSVQVDYRRIGQPKPMQAVLEAQEFNAETIFGLQRHDDNSWDYWIDGPAKIAHIRIGALTRDTSDELRAVLGSVVNNLANEPRPAKLGIAFSVLPGLRGR